MAICMSIKAICPRFPVLTLDAAGHVKKSRHAVLSGVLSLRFPVAGGGQSSSAHCDTAS